jgi:hypothetical protein
MHTHNWYCAHCPVSGRAPGFLPSQAWTRGRWCWSRHSRGCAGLWGSELLRASPVVALVVAAVAIVLFLELLFLAAPCVQDWLLC